MSNSIESKKDASIVSGGQWLLIFLGIMFFVLFLLSLMFAWPLWVIVWLGFSTMVVAFAAYRRYMNVIARITFIDGKIQLYKRRNINKVFFECPLTDIRVEREDAKVLILGKKSWGMAAFALYYFKFDWTNFEAVIAHLQSSSVTINETKVNESTLLGDFMDMVTMEYYNQKF